MIARTISYSRTTTSHTTYARVDYPQTDGLRCAAGETRPRFQTRHRSHRHTSVGTLTSHDPITQNSHVAATAWPRHSHIAQQATILLCPARGTSGFQYLLLADSDLHTQHVCDCCMEQTMSLSEFVEQMYSYYNVSVVYASGTIYLYSRRAV